MLSELEDELQDYKDQLDDLKRDMGELEFTLPEDDENLIKQVEQIDKITEDKPNPSAIKVARENQTGSDSGVFDVGEREALIGNGAKYARKNS